MIRWITGRKREQDTDNEVIVDGHDYISRGTIQIEQDASGNFYALNRVVVAGAAQVTGNITTSIADIMGHVSGDILCENVIIVRKTAVITGSIRAEFMEVERGAIINGTVCLEKQDRVGSLRDRVDRAARDRTDPADPVVRITDLPQAPRPSPAPATVPPRADEQSDPGTTSDSGGWW